MNDLSNFTFHVNKSGWGPSKDTLEKCVPKDFLLKPYAPFSKGEKLGRIADFTYKSQYAQNNNGDFQDDNEFHIVDTANVKPVRKSWRRNKVNKNYRPRAKPGNTTANNASKSTRASGNSRFNRRRQKWKERLYRPREARQFIQYQSSVKIGTEWEVVEQFELKELAKLSAPAPTKTEDLKWCGHVEYVDPKYENLSVAKKKTLARIENRIFFNVSTTDDENIEEFAHAGKGNVFTTDVLMAHLMACARSVRPWDMIIQRVGTGENKTIFFDKRDDQLDYLTVDETSSNPPDPEDKDSINDFEEENPFFDEDDAEDGEEPASVGYRYRCFHLGDSIRLVSRTELHGVMKRKGEDKYITSFALNEWQSSTEWRKKLDRGKGGVFGVEAKNNSFKIGKVVIQSILSGTDMIKFGYVSRSHFKDRSSHQILGEQYVKPSVVARLVALNTQNMWAIMRHIIEVCMKQPEGKYLLVRDPSKGILRLYKLPSGTFDDSSSEESSSEEEEGDE